MIMQRHAFGRGEYQYFKYPLPGAVEALRQAIYPHLAPIANRWRKRLNEEGRFPPSLAAYLDIGSPEEVVAQLTEVATDLNVGHLMLLLQFGSMGKDLAAHNRPDPLPTIYVAEKATANRIVAAHRHPLPPSQGITIANFATLFQHPASGDRAAPRHNRAANVRA
jgi:Oxygenase, catalysing oxidative methylation of damaged DNA